jgi:hypothetical protein
MHSLGEDLVGTKFAHIRLIRVGGIQYGVQNAEDPQNPDEVLGRCRPLALFDGAQRVTANARALCHLSSGQPLQLAPSGYVLAEHSQASPHGERHHLLFNGSHSRHSNA